jgi:hypothetical protein
MILWIVCLNNSDKVKPSYKRLYRLNEFFKPLKINVIDFRDPSLSDLIASNNGYIPSRWPDNLPLPGIHIQVHGVLVYIISTNWHGTGLQSLLDILKENVIYELKQNIKCEINREDLLEYFTKIREVMISCDEILDKENLSELSMSGYESPSLSIILALDDTEPIPLIRSQILDMLYMFQNYLRNLLIETNSIISECINTVKIDEHKFKSFKLKSINRHRSDIALLFQCLIKGKFLSKNSKLIVFEKAFKEVYMPERLIWTGYQGDLSYFIKRLKVKEIIVDPKHDIWQITSYIFLKEDGSLFSPHNLKG